jgi:DNA-binding CsgD family transcriptional regulator
MIAGRSRGGGRQWLLREPQLAGSLAKSRQMDAPDAIPDAFETLTPRELQVFHLMAEGLLNWEIGPRLSIGTRTVETHRASIMRKLGLKTQTDVVIYALRRGILALTTSAGAETDVRRQSRVRVQSPEFACPPCLGEGRSSDGLWTLDSGPWTTRS